MRPEPPELAQEINQQGENQRRICKTNWRSHEKHEKISRKRSERPAFQKKLLKLTLYSPLLQQVGPEAEETTWNHPKTPLIKIDDFHSILDDKCVKSFFLHSPKRKQQIRRFLWDFKINSVSREKMTKRTSRTHKETSDVAKKN